MSYSPVSVASVKLSSISDLVYLNLLNKIEGASVHLIFFLRPSFVDFLIDVYFLPSVDYRLGCFSFWFFEVS